jgi:hypothetical protein
LQEPDNRLSSETEYRWRENEVKNLLTDDWMPHDVLHGLFEKAYDVSIKHLHVGITSGGKRGFHCPNLHVDLVKSCTADDTLLFRLSSPRTDERVCRALIQLLDADWVDLWWMGSLGNAQLNCDRSGKSVLFPGNGKQEVLS